MVAFPRIRPLVWHILLTVFVLFIIGQFVVGLVLIMSSKVPKPDRLELNSNFSSPLAVLYFLGFFIAITFQLNIHALRAPIFIRINVSIILVCIVLQLWPFIQLARTTTPDSIERLVKQDVLARFSEKTNDTKKIIQELQAKHACCGVSGVQDYASVAEAPNSCCGKFHVGLHDPAESVGSCALGSQIPLQFQIREGCASLLMKDVQDAYNYGGLLAAVGLLFAIQTALVLFGALFHKGLETQQIS